MTHLVAKFGGADCEVGAMTTSQPPDFHLNRPGVLIAALPAVLGFVPEKSLVLVTVDRGEMGWLCASTFRTISCDRWHTSPTWPPRPGRILRSRWCRRGGCELPNVQRRIPRTRRRSDDRAGQPRHRTARRARRRPGRRRRAVALRRRLRQCGHRRGSVGVAAGGGRGAGRPPALRPARRAARSDRRRRSRPDGRARPR